MQVESVNLLDSNIYRTFFKYVSLNVLSMLGLSLYILADTFFVANGVGSNGLVSLNLVLPIYSFINGIGLLLGIGGATRFSIAIGKGRVEKYSQIFMQVIYIALGIGLVLTFIGVFFSKDIVRLLGASEDILPLANTYLKTIMCFSLPFIVNNILVCFVRNDSSPKLAMMAMMTASISNIILDYVFVFPLKMGMFGAAFATGLAPIFSMCVLSIHFMKRKNSFKFIKASILKIELKLIISSGIPSFITEFSSGIIMLIFNMVILNIVGNIGVGAYGIISNIALVCVALFTGIGQGIQPLISVFYGAGKIKDIKKVFYCACAVSIILGVFFYILGVLYPENIVSIFNKDGNIQLTEIAVQGIHIYFIAFLIMGLNIVSTSLFACVSKPKQAFTLSILRGFGAILPVVLILPKFYGMNGVWFTVPISEAITLILGLAFLILYFKKSKTEYLKSRQ